MGKGAAGAEVSEQAEIIKSHPGEEVGGHQMVAVVVGEGDQHHHDQGDDHYQQRTGNRPQEQRPVEILIQPAGEAGGRLYSARQQPPQLEACQTEQQHAHHPEEQDQEGMIVVVPHIFAGDGVPDALRLHRAQGRQLAHIGPAQQKSCHSSGKEQPSAPRHAGFGAGMPHWSAGAVIPATQLSSRVCSGMFSGLPLTMILPRAAAASQYLLPTR